MTRPVKLRVTVGPEGDDSAMLRVAGSIRRSDFSLDWAALRDARRLLVADDVRRAPTSC